MSMDKLEIAIDILSSIDGNDNVDTAQEYICQYYNEASAGAKQEVLCDYHADSPGWDECTDGQDCSRQQEPEEG